MATVDCNACGNLRENAPDFVQNGVTDTICTSLKNNTGLNPNLTVLHNNCEDLDDANDCLVGMMDEQVEAYDVCDWKEFMHKFIPNLHAVIKAEICSMCGEWAKIERHECEIKNLYSGYNFEIGESPTDNSYIVAGKGVSFLTRSAGDDFTSDIALTYIGGALVRMSGGIEFFTTSFVDKEACINFDQGSSQQTSSSRSGNSYWGNTDYNTVDGNELIYEIRVKKSAFPFIASVFNGFGETINAGGMLVATAIFNGDDDDNCYAYGQHGACYTDRARGGAAPSGTNHDTGHLVPAGWYYFQLRASYIIDLMGGEDSRKVTPYAFLGMRFNRNKIEC